MDSTKNVNSNEDYGSRYILVVTRKETSRVSLCDIIYIETQQRLIHLYTAFRTYRFYGKLDELARQLDGSFYRCHKSCVINFEKVIRMEDGIFHFTGGMTLRVGQNNYQQARSKYTIFLERHLVQDQGAEKVNRQKKLKKNKEAPK
jgi:Response regulator of the LytR/AlgR family